MPVKRYKTEDEDQLSIGQILYVKRFALTVDKKLCRGCAVCKLVCPREAITLKPVPKPPNGKARPPVISIDENRCDFHAICAVVCPFGAIKVTVNDEQKAPTVEKEAYPTIPRHIQINSESCSRGCKVCEEKCPLGIISVSVEPLMRGEHEKKGRFEHSKKTKVEIRKELCATCRVCELECPEKAIKVTKLFEGSIRIESDLCMDGCQDCLDVCPVNALYLDEDDKVQVNDAICVYCGACVNVCPRSGALQVKRTSIHHTPIRSGAWNKALEKLTSTSGLDRELQAKRMKKAREAVKNLSEVSER